jgi:outer membrane protein OmpA-like peptidoglycan-associated protein
MNMKQKLTFLFALAIFCTSVFAQQKWTASKKESLIGIHFNMADFNGPTGIKDPLTGKVYSPIKDMSKGLSFSYWKGLTNKIDFSTKLNMMFHNYNLINNGLSDKTELGLELEPTINIRPIADNSKLAPFLTAGVGVGYYTGDFGAYIPAGVGLQFNMNSVVYLFVQAQYKFSLTTDVLNDNLFYSFGLAQNITKQKPVIAPPPPPLPIVEVPKDRDGDGVLDVNDKCPDVKGLASLQGCPDRDGDGIADADDACPDVKGLAKYKGCPIPDTDKDGVNDEDDKCVTVSGVARYQGCPIPDTDGDGINDEEDKCPNVAGPADNFGCPVIGIKSYEIAFKPGSAVLLPKAKLILDTVVTYLNVNTGVNVTVDGHTDNTGTDKINDPLSLKRAEASKAYIVSKGVAADRMTTTGFGSKQPVADNKTAAGRLKNRRIEIKIKG